MNSRKDINGVKHVETVLFLFYVKQCFAWHREVVYGNGGKR